MDVCANGYLWGTDLEFDAPDYCAYCVAYRTYTKEMMRNITQAFGSLHSCLNKVKLSTALFKCSRSMVRSHYPHAAHLMPYVLRLNDSLVV